MSIRPDSDPGEEGNLGRSADPGDIREETGVRDEAMLFCPICSTRLLSLKCKLICSQCGYYMSCADYY